VSISDNRVWTETANCEEPMENPENEKTKNLNVLIITVSCPVSAGHSFLIISLSKC